MILQQVFETAKDTKKKVQSVAVDSVRAKNQNLSCIIDVDTSKKAQTFKGFGAAITESAGYVLSKLGEKKAKAVVESCYGQNPENANCYTLARTHMNSCDFSLENWACVEKKDETLESFSMERTDLYMTPALLKAKDSCSDLGIMVTPWSPPAWMKDNNDMNHGGKLLKEYWGLWAKYFVRYIQELKNRGLTVKYVSVQNEPAATQIWDSCRWEAGEEGQFAAQCLYPEFEKAGLTDIKILVWDHNREILFDRMKGSIEADPAAAKAIGGAAFHWYSGDQYDQVAKCAETWPDKDLVFTEGCIEGGPRQGKWFSGERYAHNIINDLNAGATAWIDWNMVLDVLGGPNHVGNFCDAPILADAKFKKAEYQTSFYYIGHFSRFIRPGAVRLDNKITGFMTPATIDGRMGNYMETTAFQNTDGSIAVVVMNRTEADMVFELNLKNGEASDADEKTKAYSAQADEKSSKTFVCPPRAIQTYIFK